MNWFKTILASFIDNVDVASYSGEHLTLIISGKRYKYFGVPGSYYAGEIKRWKTWENKNEAGKKVSGLIRAWDRYRIKDSE